MSLASKYAKYLMHAQAHLEPGEEVLVGVLGAYETKSLGSDTVRNGILLATDRRVVFYSKRITGYDLESFPYANISSFEQGKNLMGPHVTFYASGNKVHVKWILEQQSLQELTAVVKMRTNTPLPVMDSSVSSKGDDVFEQLTKLGVLRDSGVISLDEFEAKKVELLSRI